jgi:hypothetical protein
MADKTCAKFFEDFILSSGTNLLLCENNLGPENKEDFICYNSNLNTLCNDTMSHDYSKYWKRIKIDGHKFNTIHNFINEYKFTVSVIKKD